MLPERPGSRMATTVLTIAPHRRSYSPAGTGQDYRRERVLTIGEYAHRGADPLQFAMIPIAQHQFSLVARLVTLRPMLIDSPEFWSALAAIIAIDLVLAGDNAIVIALAARNLPKTMQSKAVLWGTVGAVVVR